MFGKAERVGRTSFVYRSAWGYEALMLVLYGRAYRARYRLIADLVEDGETVLDLCCGPAALYFRELRGRRVRYVGADINSDFIARLRKAGCEGIELDVRLAVSEDSFPNCDVAVMQSSLYQFLPDPHPILNKMFAAARRRVIIAEPVRNLASSAIPAIAWLAGRLTDPGTGYSPMRFDHASLRATLARYAACNRMWTRDLPGGREVIYVFDLPPKELE